MDYFKIVLDFLELLLYNGCMLNERKEMKQVEMIDIYKKMPCMNLCLFDYTGLLLHYIADATDDSNERDRLLLEHLHTDNNEHDKLVSGHLNSSYEDWLLYV